MKLLKSICIIVVLFILGSCNNNIVNNIDKENLNKKTEQVQSSAKSQEGRTENINLESFKTELSKNDGIVIDLRTTEELEKTGTIAGAKQIDFYASNFKDKLNSLNKNQKYLIYCRSGGRSGKTLSLMRDLGFTNVLELRGGMNGWLNAGENTVAFSKIEDVDTHMMDGEMMNEEDTMIGDNLAENMTSMMSRTVTINAKKWEFDKKIIRAKKGEDLTIKVNNIDVLHGIAIPGLKLVGDNEIKVDTSTPGEYPFVCATYCGDEHSNMTGTLIIE